MGQDGKTQIRTLPRSTEPAKKTEQKPAAQAQAPAQPPRWIIYVGSVSVVLLLACLNFPAVKGGAEAQRNLSSTAAKAPVKAAEPARSYDSVNRHLQEAAAKHEMMVRVREMENLRVSGTLDADEFANDEDSRNIGVQFDQEDTASQVYADLNEDSEDNYANETPDDKINSRLATRRWVNELERAERIAFVRNYIRKAYEKGYEVQLDNNLVVVSVKKINKTEKVNIEQVLDKLAQKGL